MIKRIVVAGCRNYDNYDEAKAFIDFCISRIRLEYTLIFMSGASSGADTLGERYAKQNGYKIERYPALWDKYGRAAGPIRNKEMAKRCDMVICFWDRKSRGTRNMLECAKELNKAIKIKYI